MLLIGMRLNPCFRGLLVIDFDWSYPQQNKVSGLNPCFRGLLVIDSILFNREKITSRVLILVFVDY